MKGILWLLTPTVSFLIFYFPVEAFCFSDTDLDYTTISLSPSGKPFHNVGESLAEYPQVNYGANIELADKIKRGEYLVKLGDCIGCHTQKNGKAFAGGLGFSTPFGTIYSPNITPDQTTGIGKWSQTQFFHAVKQGIAPKQTYLYPAFPYIYYNKINERDLDDMKAYLDAIPPVQQKNKKNHLYFPFNFRFLQIGWRLLFFEFQKTDHFKNNPQRDAEWNRGAYLVQSLGHCDMCHTPMHYVVLSDFVLGAPNRKYHLNGAYVSGFYAPNITSLLLKNTDLNSFQNVFWQNRLLEGRSVQGPMHQVNHDSLQFLNADDIRAIFTYLQSLPSKTPAKPKNGKDLDKKIYQQYCQQCHDKGKGPVAGAPKFGDRGDWQIWLSLGREQLYHLAYTGVDGMPIKGTCTDCTPEKIKMAVEYILTHSLPTGDPK